MAKMAKKLLKKSDHRVKPDIVLDNIFFHKSQLVPGVKLIYYGRWEPMSIWEIVEIKSHYLGKEVGDIKYKKVQKVIFLSDSLALKNVATGEIRTLTFSYMSYSAIWRLA